MRELGPEELEVREQLRERGYGYEALCAEMRVLGWVVALWLPPTVEQRGRPLDRGCSVRIFRAPPLSAKVLGGFPRPRAAGDLVMALAAPVVTEPMLNKLAVAIRAELQVNGWLAPLTSQ